MTADLAELLLWPVELLSEDMPYLHVSPLIDMIKLHALVQSSMHKLSPNPHSLDVPVIP